jgi:hypothetical protein
MVRNPGWSQRIKARRLEVAIGIEGRALVITSTYNGQIFDFKPAIEYITHIVRCKKFIDIQFIEVLEIIRIET